MTGDFFEFFIPLTNSGLATTVQTLKPDLTFKFAQLNKNTLIKSWVYCIVHVSESLWYYNWITYSLLCPSFCFSDITMVQSWSTPNNWYTCCHKRNGLPPSHGWWNPYNHSTTRTSYKYRQIKDFCICWMVWCSI